MSEGACVGCGLSLGAGIVACPSCQRLVHGERLKALADEAKAAGDDVSRALTAWRAALELLPPGSNQHSEILRRVTSLKAKLEGAAPPPASAPAGKRTGVLAALGGVGLLLLKFKAVPLFLFGKGKLLLLGLTKASTFFSMLLSLGVYWALWGWAFALAFVLSIYLHEMGHVAMMRRYGMAVSAPMFVPGLGAFVRAKSRLDDPVESARIGLAGPIWGMVASFIALGLHFAFASPMFAAVARFNAWINLFNLLPAMGLDGAHAFRAIGKVGRLVVAAAMGAAWLYSGDGILLLLGGVAVFRAIGTPADQPTDARALIEYLGLIGVLTLLLQIAVEVGSRNP